MKERSHKELLASIKENCHDDLARLLDLASEKGASSWLTSLPLADYGFHLNKQHFIMRYDRGYVILQHRTERDASKELLCEVCKGC